MVFKKTIVVFISTLESGGAEKQAVLLTKALQNDFNTILVVWRGNLVESKFMLYIDENKIQTLFLKGSFLVRFFSFYSLLKTAKVRFIFNFLASNNFFGTLAGKLAGVSNIIGGIRNAEVPIVKLMLQRYLHNHYLNFTIFNNYMGKENLINKGFKEDKCIVIPNSYELASGPIVREYKESVTIVSLARFVPQKDFYTALLAIHYLVDKLNFASIDIKYRIVGYGKQENRIHGWITELGLEKYVEIIINPRNALCLLKESDIFLSSSLFEGTSNSIMEAMACSLPIVATDAGDNKYLVENNKNGFISPIRDYEQLATNLAILIGNPELRNEFGLFGYQKIKNEYSMAAFRDKYLTLIEKVAHEFS
jgi:glycosyltransferase involved in cell wall biosynthesis